MLRIEPFWVDRASRLTGLTPRRIVAWDREGVFHPRWPNDDRGHGRRYSFRDLVGLRALAVLRDRHRVPLKDLRGVWPWLGKHQEAPLASLRIRVDGRHVYLEETGSDRTTVDGQLGDGAVTLELADVAAELRERIEAARRRRPEDVGRIVRNRRIQGNVPILAGTRMPTSSIWSFHEAGYSVEQILEQYPHILPEDVQAAIDFERERRAG
jgi:uncharacterized protein (DUF433 family)